MKNKQKQKQKQSQAVIVNITNVHKKQKRKSQRNPTERKTEVKAPVHQYVFHSHPVFQSPPQLQTNANDVKANQALIDRLNTLEQRFQTPLLNHVVEEPMPVEQKSTASLRQIKEKLPEVEAFPLQDIKDIKEEKTATIRHVCPLCSKIFKTKDTLRSHMLKYHSPGSFGSNRGYKTVTDEEIAKILDNM